MRIPKQFTHKGKVWRVVYKANLILDGDPCHGLCDYDNRILFLDTELRKKGFKRRRVSTFLHELCHVVIHEAHINRGCRFSQGVEETTCDAFTDLLTTSFTELKWKS